MHNAKQHRGKRRIPQLPPHQYIETAADWQAFLERLNDEPRIAFDLEANSMYAYEEQICLIQVSVPGQDFIVDPLAEFSLSALGEIIEDATVEKVFHAAEYDLILMKKEYGWRLNNLFDTMWAARILGYQRVGLASILEDLFKIRLNKRFQRANWCKRPLSEGQLAYAQADTHYLLNLRDHFAAELTATGCTVEAAEIFEEQSQVEVNHNGFDPDSFWSMAGVKRLTPEGQATLRALTIYRDHQARRRNKPYFKVLQNRTLLELARKRPADKRELNGVFGMSQGQIHRYGDDLLRIIRENIGAPAPGRPRPKPRPSEEIMARYEKLRTWRKERGQARGVESDVIISRSTLWAIARANPQTAAELEELESMGPWRCQAYGDEILQVISS